MCLAALPDVAFPASGSGLVKCNRAPNAQTSIWPRSGSAVGGGNLIRGRGQTVAVSNLTPGWIASADLRGGPRRTMSKCFLAKNTLSIYECGEISSGDRELSLSRFPLISLSEGPGRARPEQGLRGNPSELPNSRIRGAEKGQRTLRLTDPSAQAAIALGLNAGISPEVVLHVSYRVCGFICPSQGEKVLCACFFHLCRTASLKTRDKSVWWAKIIPRLGQRRKETLVIVQGAELMTFSISAFASKPCLSRWPHVPAQRCHLLFISRPIRAERKHCIL
ncbi:hypothetical protein PO909_014186 [Leuciscus waleckii]